MRHSPTPRRHRDADAAGYARATFAYAMATRRAADVGIAVDVC